MECTLVIGMAKKLVDQSIRLLTTMFACQLVRGESYVLESENLLKNSNGEGDATMINYPTNHKSQQPTI